MNNSEQIITRLINGSVTSAQAGNFRQAQESLNRLYSLFNKPGGGRLITSYPHKQELGESFSMMLEYDWVHDSDIREVWAENGFYCYIKAIREQQNATAESQAVLMLGLFVHLHLGCKSLMPKVNNILATARRRLEPIFSFEDYNHNAEYILDQFAFMAVHGARPAIIDTPEIIEHFSIKYPGFENFFKQSVSRREFMQLNPFAIFNKAKFIANIIESILNDM
jgi:hypothetical protein